MAVHRTLVMASPEQRRTLADLGVPFSVVNADVQAGLDRERIRLEQRPTRYDNDTVRRTPPPP